MPQPVASSSSSSPLDFCDDHLLQVLHGPWLPRSSPTWPVAAPIIVDRRMWHSQTSNRWSFHQALSTMRIRMTMIMIMMMMIMIMMKIIMWQSQTSTRWSFHQPSSLFLSIVTPRRCTRFQIGLYLKRFNHCWLEKGNLQKAKSEKDFPQVPSQIYLQMVYDEFLWSLTNVHTVHTLHAVRR